jgi:hypothetical protein
MKTVAKRKKVKPFRQNRVCRLQIGWVILKAKNEARPGGRA